MKIKNYNIQIYSIKAMFLCMFFFALPPIFISLPISFAQSFRRNNVVGHRRKEKVLFYIKVECMCDEKLVVPLQKSNQKK